MHLLAALGIGWRLPYARTEPLAHQQIERGLVPDHDVSRRLDLRLPRIEELEDDGARAHEDETRVVVDVPAAVFDVAVDIDAIGRRENVRESHRVLTDECRRVPHPRRVRVARPHVEAAL